MGVLERDNYPILNKETNEVEFRKENASVLAATSRNVANTMLGGEESFSALMT